MAMGRRLRGTASGRKSVAPAIVVLLDLWRPLPNILSLAVAYLRDGRRRRGHGQGPYNGEVTASCSTEHQFYGDKSTEIASDATTGHEVNVTYQYRTPHASRAAKRHTLTNISS